MKCLISQIKKMDFIFKVMEFHRGSFSRFSFTGIIVAGKMESGQDWRCRDKQDVTDFLFSLFVIYKNVPL